MGLVPAGPVAVISVHADPLAHLGLGHNGGMNLAIRRLSSELAARGVETDIFTRRTGASDVAQEWIAPGARVVRISAGPPAQLDPEAASRHVDEFVAAVHEHARASGRRYPIVHAHHWVAGLVAEGLRALWDTTWLQSFHTMARTKRLAGLAAEPGRELVETRFGRDADLLVVTRAEARELSELRLVEPRRLAVIDLGIDAPAPRRAAAASLRARLGLGNARVVLYAGRLDPVKGTDTLLEAIACLVAGSAYADVVAVVVGDDSVAGERERLSRLAVGLGIESRVRFVGAVDHAVLEDYYGIADVCVVPSRTESFGLVALEAQASGHPVVAANVGGLRDIVIHESTGLLVEAGDAGGFCRALARILDEPDLRHRLGEAARIHAANYTWERSAAQLERIYAGFSDVASAPTCSVAE